MSIVMSFLCWMFFFRSPNYHIFSLLDAAYLTETTKIEELCTSDFLKKYAKAHTLFMQSGRLVRLGGDNVNSSTKVIYIPGICSIKSESDEPFWFTSCLEKTKTKKIIFLGDSNTRKPVRAFFIIRRLVQLGIVHGYSGAYMCVKK